MMTTQRNDIHQGQRGIFHYFDAVVSSRFASLPVGNNDKKRSRKQKSALFLAVGCALFLCLAGDMYFNRDAEDYLNSAEHDSTQRLLSTADGEAVPDEIDAGEGGVGPTFVFIMGIEGTGHHFFGNLLGHSPNMMAMHELGVCKGGELPKMMTQFFHESWGNPPLFNPKAGNRANLDAGKIVDNVVSYMKTIRDKFNNDRPTNDDDGEPYHVAINANSCGGNSMLSYPTFMGPDRALQNFNLDVFYAACDDANVPCKHAYIYRDPYDVIKSTSKNRDYNNKNSMYDIVRLYTSVLQQVHSQLVSFPERNLGCFGFLDPEGHDKGEDWERFGKLWGWDHDEFMAIANEVNTKRPHHMSLAEKDRLVPSRLGVMMRALVQIHERVRGFCYESLREMEDQNEMTTIGLPEGEEVAEEAGNDAGEAIAEAA